MAMDVTPQTPTSGRKSSGYRRLQGRHREIIELYENLMKDHAALTAKHEELQLDVQRLLEQHTRLMQAVRSGPNWAEMANDTLTQLAAHPNPAALQGTAAALAQLQNHLAAIVARAGVYP